MCSALHIVLGYEDSNALSGIYSRYAAIQGEGEISSSRVFIHQS